MAKYIEIPSLRMFTYALDECEDYLVIESYLTIKESIKARDLKYIKVFEFYHLQEGGTLNDNIFLRLNGFLRQLGRASLVFVNGHTTNYASLRGQEKVVARQRILDHLRLLSPVQRADLIVQKEAEAARLPGRNPDLPSRAPPSTGDLTRSETERRRAALANSQKVEAGRNIPPGVGSGPATVTTPPASTSDPEREFIPESTVQDNVIELITEMQDLRAEVASLKSILQTIFKNV